MRARGDHQGTVNHAQCEVRVSSLTGGPYVKHVSAVRERFRIVLQYRGVGAPSTVPVRPWVGWGLVVRSLDLLANLLVIEYSTRTYWTVGVRTRHTQLRATSVIGRVSHDPSKKPKCRLLDGFKAFSIRSLPLAAVNRRHVVVDSGLEFNVPCTKSGLCPT